jgi:hypothetical protein
MVSVMRQHANPVAQYRASGKRTARIDRNHCDSLPFAPKHSNELIDQRAFADSRRAGDTDRQRTSAMRKQSRKQAASGRVTVLDERSSARNCTDGLSENLVG